MPKRLSTLPFISLVLIAAGCATPSSAGSSTAAAAPAPSSAASAASDHRVAEDFSLRDVEGKDIHLSDYTGKVVLVDFWATWCVPCTAEIPHLEELYEKYGSQGFVVIGVSMDGPETEAQVLPFIQRNGLTFPVAVDEETRVINAYNPTRAAPLSVLIDRHGQITRVREGYDIGDEKLIEKDVLKLLPQ